ncbi:uncharacterized protein LOC105189161 [Harpegnathos saltator]|uniref:uncharacterized protein LOC105189161 n=1 Tax=Harpegnathos saltator TaxID=610380 RepID=UPI000DBEE2F8|nr:uncharacterized protein LOC105189161 [Harpegnathos saltator]
MLQENSNGEAHHSNSNQFFHPNICHVCKSRIQDSLRPCNWCHMISYCCEEHKWQHRPHHIEICTIITDFINDDPQWYDRCYLYDDWVKLQASLIRIIQVILKRQLEPYEMQMFMFTKACFICHQRHTSYTCEYCLSVSYCSDHVHHIYKHYGSMCYQMSLCLNLDVRFSEDSVWESLRIKNIFPDVKRPFTNMESFCNQYCHITDYISDPLTLYNGMQSAHLFHPEAITNTFVIHIIAANNVDRRNFLAWELLLHLLNRITKLIIVLIGPELEPEYNEHQTCFYCKEDNKRLILEASSVLYHDYVFHINYRRPNVIVGFQAELHRPLPALNPDSWSESIKTMQSQKCPVLLTATLSCKAEYDITMIQQVLGPSVKPILSTFNDFRTFRPYRDFEAGYVSFRNIYLTVYDNLNV